jgi:hypothetical protein
VLILALSRIADAGDSLDPELAGGFERYGDLSTTDDSQRSVSAGVLSFFENDTFRGRILPICESG